MNYSLAELMQLSLEQRLNIIENTLISKCSI